MAAASKTLIDLMRAITRIGFVDVATRARAAVLLGHFEDKDPFAELFGDKFAEAFRKAR